MKSISLLLASLSFAAAIALPVDAVTQAVDITDAKPDDVKIPENVYLEPALKEQEKPLKDGATLKTVKYGPYRVPAMGSLENRIAIGLEKPCVSCYIVGIQANLVYASSGKTANIDEGAWLHHMVIYNTGFGRRDAVCSTLPIAGQRIFASGNERTPIRTNGGDNKYGIEFKTTDSLSLIYDLMNESKQAQSYYVEMTYEVLPLTTPGYKPVKMAWLDITGCGFSDYPAKTGVYEVKSPEWRSTVSGKLLSATGHEHDAGAEVVVYKNGKPICTSDQLYGRRPAWVGGMDKMSHISDTGSCVEFGEIKVGDTLNIGAKYNTTAHPLDKKMSGFGNSPIMGICQVYIG